jgi:crotonobetainyl-CoA:carnitine CoA-transferase CaiB-like acyl-CoA transferase
MLSDLLVVDLTRHLPGPYATQLLASHGARVIKVEQPPLGDPVRAMPPHDAQGVSAIYRALNRGKQSLALNLKHPQGQAALRRLLERADVLVEGFRPGVLARLGVDVEATRAANPRLVVCSISGYGQDGPYRDRPGHDLNYQAYAGALGLNVDRAGHVVVPGVQVGDVTAGLSAFSGVLLALLERARTGRGRAVDVSMLDAAVSVQAINLLPHLRGAPAVPGELPLSGGMPAYGVFRCADGGAVAMGILEPKFWATFCEIVDRADWVDRQFDPSLRDELDALFATRPRDAWRVILEDADCCLAPVLSYDEVVDDPQVKARELISPDRVAPPMRFDPPCSEEGLGPAAQAGAHTREVLLAHGFVEAEVAELLEAGAAVQA